MHKDDLWLPIRIREMILVYGRKSKGKRNSATKEREKGGVGRVTRINNSQNVR